MKNINLSTTTSITTTYAGESAGKYIAAALLSAPTLEKGGITIMPNVKFKQVIKRVATDNIIKNATYKNNMCHSTQETMTSSIGHERE